MPPRKPPEGATPPLRAHIQGRLHSDTQDGGREHDALAFYYGQLAEEKWDDRKIITEALLALRMYWEEGYRPPDPQPIVINSEIQAGIKALREHMKMLSELDLTSLRSQPAWKEEVYQDTSDAISSGAAAIMGHAKTYDDDDD